MNDLADILYYLFDLPVPYQPFARRSVAPHLGVVDKVYIRIKALLKTCLLPFARPFHHSVRIM